MWDPESGETPPEEFLGMYSEEEWQNRDPQYFIERIDGPYTMLTEMSDKKAEQVEIRERTDVGLDSAEGEDESEEEPKDFEDF